VPNGFQTLDIGIFTVALVWIAGRAFTGIGRRLFVFDLYRFIQLEGVRGWQWEEARWCKGRITCDWAHTLVKLLWGWELLEEERLKVEYGPFFEVWVTANPLLEIIKFDLDFLIGVGEGRKLEKC
jgi:hypothetical protein